MSGNNNNQQPQRDRSPSVEIVEVRGRAEVRDNRTAPQQQPGAAPGPPAAPPNPQARPAGWGAAMRTFEAGAGPRDPPRRNAQMNLLTTGQRDLTQLYGSAQYPSLDYGYSLAAASTPSLQAPVRDMMGRFHSPLRTQPHAPNVVNRPPLAQVPVPRPNQPAAASMGHPQAGQAAPPIAPPNPTAPHTATPAASTAPPVNNAPPTTNTVPPAVNRAPAGAQASNPGETPLELIHRQHGIDVNDLGRYSAGMRPLPQNLLDLVNHIESIKKNNWGFPIRTELKLIENHFVQPSKEGSCAQHRFSGSSTVTVGCSRGGSGTILPLTGREMGYRRLATTGEASEAQRTISVAVTNTGEASKSVLQQRLSK